MRPPTAFSGGGVPVSTLPMYQAATGSMSRRGTGGTAVVDALGERQRHAAARETRVEHGEIGELHADAAERHGKTGRLAFRKRQRRARLASRVVRRLAPTFSSSETAGTLSDICNALRTVTVPWNVRSKFSGA